MQYSFISRSIHNPKSHPSSLSCHGEKQNGETVSQLNQKEALEASRYASHPYSTHRREVNLFEAIILISFVGAYVFWNLKGN